jgi:SAM-dependent methyltransferase
VLTQVTWRSKSVLTPGPPKRKIKVELLAFPRQSRHVSAKMILFIDRIVVRLFTSWNIVISALRRVELPHSKLDRTLVLDVGGGGLPNPYAHVVVESDPGDGERATPLRKTKLFVWGHAENLPFRNKVFSYSVLSHVLEHLESPAPALNELQRVSRAGYIETPNAMYEYTIPHTYHLSHVDCVERKLRVTFKRTWDQSFSEAGLRIAARQAFDVLVRLRPNALLTRFQWRDSFEFEIIGVPFQKDDALIASHSAISKRSWLKSFFVALVYKITTPRTATRLEELLACPKCKSDLILDATVAVCTHCNQRYRKFLGFWDFRC